MKGYQIEITPEDKGLYEAIIDIDGEESIKKYLANAVELYQFCNGTSGEMPGYLTPENLKERKLKGMKKEELLKLREEYLKDLLLFAQDFHPDEVDCGIMRGPDTEWWFVDDGGRLGYITVYANYIKMIDEVLDENIKKEESSNEAV